MLKQMDSTSYQLNHGADRLGADSGTDMYPFTFTEDGKVTFKAAAPNGDVVVKFKFEYNPYPNTTPEFYTDTVTVTGADEATYEVVVHKGNKYISAHF